MHAVIIGSGIAGLSAAIRLKVKGYDVSVYEANSYPGGKLTEISVGDYRFDAGPSLFTMPHLVDELFVLAGKNPTDYFTYIQKKVACNYFYEDGTTLVGYAEPNAFSDEIEEVLGVSKSKVLDYLKGCGERFSLTGPLFLEKSLHDIKTFFSVDVLKAIMQIRKLHIFQTMHSVNAKALKHPKLVQLFDRYATYNGSSPYLAPGILTMIPHLEFNIGTFFPVGGMYKITSSLEKLALDIGVNFNYDQPVQEIVVSGDAVKGVRVNGILVPADKVVSNMDIVPTYKKLLPKVKQPQEILSQERSSSALIFYWGIRTRFKELDLHNIFFSDDYQKEFDLLFKKGEVTDDPTVYVNISSKENLNDAPEGSENWFVMVNVPSDQGQDWDAIIPKVKANVLKKLSKLLKTDVSQLIEEEELLTPQLIQQRTSSLGGALYGTSSNARNAAFLRHANTHSKIKGLHFCGGSVHPGGGIPLCLLSGKIATDKIKSI